MIVGVVGSRRRKDRQIVYELIDSLPLKDTDLLISGGCRGVDSWAEERARTRGIKVRIFKPDLSNLKDNWDMISRYYARNKKIAEEVDILYAFVSPDRKGGTENTIKYAEKLRKTILIM